MSALLSLPLTDYFQTYEHNLYRMVEGQHFISTRKLVNSDAEHHILETILDQSKPAVKTTNSRGELHYLLYTPFRYPPLISGGRFHTRIDQSIFYGSQELTTSMAEIAYGRFLFAQQSAAIFKPVHVPYTHFVVEVGSKKALLFTNTPLFAFRDLISDPASYAHSQPLGSAMRRAGAELFTYFSARCEKGINVGLFSSEAFKKNIPTKGKEGHWSVYIGDDVVEFKRAHPSHKHKEIHIFHIVDFYVNGQFPILT
jgi:hypothetical protein